MKRSAQRRFALNSSLWLLLAVQLAPLLWLLSLASELLHQRERCWVTFEEDGTIAEKAEPLWRACKPKYNYTLLSVRLLPIELNLQIGTATSVVPQGLIQIAAFDLKTVGCN